MNKFELANMFGELEPAYEYSDDLFERAGWDVEFTFRGNLFIVENAISMEDAKYKAAEVVLDKIGKLVGGIL